jgi:hypothetical protein
MAGNLPDLTEDYQRKLKAFLEDVPPLGSGEIPSGKPAMLPPATREKIAAADLVTDPRFRKYTGWEHKSLLEKWLGDKTTTCNEFCQKCALAMGYAGKDGIGRFDIADWLASRGLGHVWVRADSNATPEYGDIFRLYDSVPDANGMRLNHMAVSLWVDGSDWFTVESGQGGPSKGFDSLMRKKRVWKPGALRGWVSMKALLHAETPLPYWLGGWWAVEEGSYEQYYYYFAANGKVYCTAIAPSAMGAPPVAASPVGSFAIKRMFSVEISWNSADVSETMTLVRQDAKARQYLMQGKTARGVGLSAQRMMQQNAFG